MGAILSRGRVVRNCIRCPFHEWEFDQQGRCVHIPAAGSIPEFARQQVYPTAVIGPHVLIFNQPSASYAAPFFDGIDPGSLLSAAAFEFVAEMPWYMVAANGFDIQHFRAAHDRTLLDEPVIGRPSPWAYRVRATFDVTGDSVSDRLTRYFSGPHVTMTVTSWCGTLVFVTAEFARTTSYGLVCIRPIDRNRSHVRNIVWVARRSGALRLLDPFDALIRRWFIRRFVQGDRARSEGIRYNPGSLIDADRVLSGYYQWLGQTVKGETFDRSTST